MKQMAAKTPGMSYTRLSRVIGKADDYISRVLTTGRRMSVRVAEELKHKTGIEAHPLPEGAPVKADHRSHKKKETQASAQETQTSLFDEKNDREMTSGEPASETKSSEERTKPLFVRISDDLDRYVRIRAALDNTSITAFVITTLEDKMRNDKEAAKLLTVMRKCNVQ